MIESEVVDRARFEIKFGEYSVGPATALSDASALTAAQDYRRGTASRMVPVGKEDLSLKVPNAEYHASRKVDGEFTVLNWLGGEAFTINPGVTVRIGLPWLQEAKAIFEQAGIKSARIAGELFVHHDTRRPRVHDVTKIARGPKSEVDLQRIRFAPFDIIEIDGEGPSENFASTFQTLESLFAKSEKLQPVETRIVKDRESVKSLFRSWVEEENAEGIVLRARHPEGVRRSAGAIDPRLADD